jgi:hypothetical protein
MYNDLDAVKGRTYTFKLELSYNGGGGKYESSTSTIHFQLGAKYDFESAENTRYGILAHETGHAWLELHKLEQPSPVINENIQNLTKKSPLGFILNEIPSARDSDIAEKYAHHKETNERAAMDIENIVRSELIKSTNFSSLELRQFYIGGQSAKLVKSNFGNLRFQLESKDYDVLIAPKDKNYYMQNQHDIYKLNNVKPIKQ